MTGQRGFRSGRGQPWWYGVDIKPRGSTNCHVVGNSCLPIENWQWKIGHEIDQAINQYQDQHTAEDLTRRRRSVSYVT